jgi:hypothetical protein
MEWLDTSSQWVGTWGEQLGSKGRIASFRGSSSLILNPNFDCDAIPDILLKCSCRKCPRMKNEADTAIDRSRGRIGADDREQRLDDREHVHNGWKQGAYHLEKNGVPKGLSKTALGR